MPAKSKRKKSQAKKRSMAPTVTMKQLKKGVKKKSLKKKLTKKKAAKKKASVKRTASKKRVQKTGSTLIGAKETTIVEPGPPGLTVPPVEEPALNEEAIGTVTHYYSELGVAVVQINKGMIRTGDTIRFKGHTTDFTQQLESMEYEHQHVEQATAGQNVGVKVIDHTREHDILYRVR